MGRVGATGSSEAELRWTVRTLVEHDVPFSVNTDGPEMLQRSLRDEIDWLLETEVLSLDEALRANRWAAEYAFVS